MTEVWWWEVTIYDPATGLKCGDPFFSLDEGWLWDSMEDDGIEVKIVWKEV